MTAPAEERIAQLCGMMNDAALGAGSWLDYLHAAKAAVGVDVASIETIDKTTGHAQTVITELLGEAATREYEERIIFVNPRLHAWPDPEPLRIYANRHLPREADQSAREYNDWADRHGVCPWFAGGIVLDNRDYFAISAMLSHKRTGPADAGAEVVWTQLLRHLNNALSIEAALAPRGEAGTIFDEAGRDGNRAYALVDRGGTLLEVSTAFERLVEGSGTLLIHNRRLEAVRQEDRWRLDSLLQAALGPSPGRPPYPLRFRPPDAGQGLLLRALPLASSRELFERLRPAALLVLTDLDAPAVAQAADLRAVWGLTEREADLAMALAQGRRLDEAAALLGIGEGTARHHLKNIFRRMDIDRQADLVRLVAKLGG